MTYWVSGYEGLYEVCVNGDIFRHYKSRDKKKLKPSQNKSGYLVVSLSKDCAVKTLLVHRIVADTFITNPENKPFVDHKDEDKTNNCVDNLRWCTPKENSDYYNTKDGRQQHILWAKKRKELLKTYENSLQEARRELAINAANLARKEKEIALLQNKLKEQEALLVAYKENFESYVENELKRLSSNYEGYRDVTGTNFGSVKNMVELTGKKVTIDGKVFKSAGEGAEYIVTEELKVGRTRNKATISKELRRFLQGKRPSWEMYNKYVVTY